ncbi:hypothetical protein [Aliiroseovarius crassostreae]|uniref:hypothetical protein n=1 Tax=Aliiroseovarius crassostreae TaxID=154981 RepID=UPI002201DAE1|nr:hypothetical protein [Aliiroseovarius crassostreae]UWP90329.1 hypothetical protein K3J57_06590 [Aliiroseovarius crassostreae]UWQ02992.1 hypothetical protein K3X44_06655 [Aliiroseovarius crassostreae]
MIAQIDTSHILAVGDLVAGDVETLPLPDRDRVSFVEFSDVTEELIHHLNPGLVISFLMSRSFDCLDLALQLQAIGFHGKYRVMAPEITNPKVIKSEISAQAPGVDFDIVTGLETL